jgi:hypothetical protein
MDETEKSMPTDTHNSEASHKASYHAPKLIKYGLIRNLTKGGSGGVPEPGLGGGGGPPDKRA